MVADQIEHQSGAEIGLNGAVAAGEALTRVGPDPFENGGEFPLLVSVVVIGTSPSLRNPVGLGSNGSAFVLPQDFDAAVIVAWIDEAEPAATDPEGFVRSENDFEGIVWRLV